MDAIVFGGAGFIGTHLIRRLAARGLAVMSIDLRVPRRPVDGVTYKIGDVRDLRELQFQEPISTIYNFAAIHTTPGHPDPDYYETNILGALEVCSFARRHKVKAIVFTSSISVYGAGEDTKSEDTTLTPNTPYGRSKRMAERIHKAWFDEAEDRKLTIVRPAVIFGSGEGGNFTRLAGLLRKGIFVYPGRKDTIKACFYVEDLLDAIEFAQGKPERCVLFNGCYPDRYTLEQIVETFRAASFPKARTVKIPKPAVLAIASALRPTSVMGMGIHPDRVMKLVRSTDVRPGWLISEGFAREKLLPSALKRWAEDSAGRFD